MPQEFQALSCVTCKTCQVQIVKKAKKWNCKICNTKQSVIQVYAKGTAAECREIVQQLNLARGESELRENNKTLVSISQEEASAFAREEIFSGLENSKDQLDFDEAALADEHVDSYSQQVGFIATEVPTHPAHVRLESGVVTVSPEQSFWKYFVELEGD